MGFSLRLCSLKWLNTIHRHCKCSFSILRRQSHHTSRLSSVSGSVPLGSSALTFKLWLGHYKAQMACVCTWRILVCPWWKQCIALMPHPLQSAKNLLSGPSRRSILHQWGSWWLLVSGEADRSLFWFQHSVYENQCKSIDLHLSCTLIQLHYTMGSDWSK